jgi:hypothetical protein
MLLWPPAFKRVGEVVASAAARGNEVDTESTPSAYAERGTRLAEHGSISGEKMVVEEVRARYFGVCGCVA